jgi:CBS domain containing-hemolysin-like protein
MWLLITYISIALIFSFLCSIFEAVLLSVSEGYIALLKQQKKKVAELLEAQKTDIAQPLAAILTLNTIAHTLGAAGAGAQATKLFGETYLGIISAILTLAILVFSEIIPKTLGARYWQVLAPATAYALKYLVKILYPFVYLADKLTRTFSNKPLPRGLNRLEFAAMAKLSFEEGHIEAREQKILANLLRMQEVNIKEAMTPRTVVTSIAEHTQVAYFFHKYDGLRFSRIPIYGKEPDDIKGFVLRSDLLLAQARGNGNSEVKNYCRQMPSLLATMKLSQAFDEFLRSKAHIILVVNEYGVPMGILTLEDLFESILGHEILDEGDKTENMRHHARKRWHKKIKERGIRINKD